MQKTIPVVFLIQWIHWVEIHEKNKKSCRTNNYFTTIWKILSNRLIDPEKTGKKGFLKSMFLTSTNEAKISLNIKKLKNQCSVDFDALNNFTLKKIE